MEKILRCDKIEKIEKVDGVKFYFNDYTRLHLESGRQMEMTLEGAKNYEVGDKIRYYVDDNDDLIWRRRAEPLVENDSLIERESAKSY